MTSRRLLLLAATAGLAHAVASLYWAAGGTWLLATVGQWAVDWSYRSPGVAVLVLLGIGLGKAVLALTPIVVSSPPRWMRLSWWVCGLVLVGYGGLNSLSAIAVLTGLAPRPDGTVQAALIGHALLWDPLFLLWGGALVTGLWSAARERHPALHEPRLSPAPPGTGRPTPPRS